MAINLAREAKVLDALYDRRQKLADQMRDVVAAQIDIQTKIDEVDAKIAAEVSSVRAKIET